MIKFNPVIEDNPNVDFENPEAMQSLVFASEEQKIIGTLFKAAGKEKKPTVILLHGLPGNEHSFDVAHAIKRFGFNVVIFHYRGTWGSNGEFSISNSLTDVYTAVEYFTDKEISTKYNINKDKIILVGHSMGGFLAMLASLKFPNIKNVASLAGFNFGLFSEFLLQNPQFVQQTMDGLSNGSELLNGTTPQKIFDEMNNNRDSWNLLNKARELKDKNLLLIGAEFDYVAPLDIHHYPLVKTLESMGAKLKKTILSSGHSFSSARIKLATEVIDWLEDIKW